MMIKVKRPFGYYDTALGIIGRTGENGTRTIDFDCTTALTEYPDANIICVCLRPGDDEPYTIPLSTDGDHRILTLASADLEKEGRLTLELRMVDGDKVLKSARFTGTVTSSLQGEGDAPGMPVRDTLDRLDAEIKAAQAVVDDIRVKLNAGEFDGPQGPKGDPGSDASVTAANIQSALGYAPVKDVQVAGNSVQVDGVAKVPNVICIRNDNSIGVVNPPQSTVWEGMIGISKNTGNIILAPSTPSTINIRAPQLVGGNVLDYAVKAAMCDGKGAAWTADEQAAARERIGASKDLGTFEDIATVTITEEASAITVNADSNGNPFSLSDIICEITLPVESTAKQRNIYFGCKISTDTTFSRVAITTNTSYITGAITYARVAYGRVICEGAISGPSNTRYQPYNKYALFNGHGGIKAESFDSISVFTYSGDFPAGTTVALKGTRK